MTQKITELLNITYPIMLGGMGNISNAKLTAAVSNAGGLGTIGCGTMTPNEVREIIIATKKQTEKPFSVNIAINVTPYVDELIELIIEENVQVVSLSAGNPTPLIPRLKEAGVHVLTIVAAVKHAQKAVEAGADAVIAEGFEAAGINSNLELTTMTLIPQIVKHIDVPVISAGGIGDGKGLAAAWMLGAQGVQMGTRFIATKEAPFHPLYKEAIISATDTTTQIIGRSAGRTRRVIAGEYTKNILQKEKSGLTMEQFDELTSEAKHIEGALHGNFSSGYINGGQISGLIDSIPTVKQLIEDMMEEAKKQLQYVQMNLI